MYVCVYIYVHVYIYVFKQNGPVNFMTQMYVFMDNRSIFV